MPTPTHTARLRAIPDRLFAARDIMLRELYRVVDVRDKAKDAGNCTVDEFLEGDVARRMLDEILAGSTVASKSGRSVELVLHEDGPVLETLSVLRRLDGVYMAVLWGLIDGGTRADHTVRAEHDGLLRLAHELIDRLNGDAPF